MSGQKHPDTEALASFRAGLIGGLRGRRLAAHIAGCARCASVSDQLGAVSSMLASVPAAALPEAFQSQITAAIAAEAAARESAASAAATSPAGASSASRDSAERVAPAPRPRPAPARRRQPGFRFRPAMAIVPVIAFVLAGFGYLLSRPGPSSSSSSAASEAAPVPTAAAASASAPVRGPAAAARPSDFAGARFVVIASGTNYQAATLRAQVLSQIAAQSASSTAVPSAVHSPGASSPVARLGTNGTASGSGGATPAPALTGCALSLTGSVTPSLVDRATYEGKPVYVIAVPDRAWVVGRGCTASHPDVIASVALTGAP